MPSLGLQSLVHFLCINPISLCQSISFFFRDIISLHDLSVLFLDPGEGVTVEDEVVVINSIVLPYKTLDVSVQDEIIL